MMAWFKRREFTSLYGCPRCAQGFVRIKAKKVDKAFKYKTARCPNCFTYGLTFSESLEAFREIYPANKDAMCAWVEYS